MGSQQRNTWFLRNGWDMKLKLRRGVGCLSERQIRTIIVFRFILGLLHIFLFEHSITVSATPAFGSPAIIKHFQMWKSWNSLFSSTSDAIENINGLLVTPSPSGTLGASTQWGDPSLSDHSYAGLLALHLPLQNDQATVCSSWGESSVAQKWPPLPVTVSGWQAGR